MHQSRDSASLWLHDGSCFVEPAPPKPRPPPPSRQLSTCRSIRNVGKKKAELQKNRGFEKAVAVIQAVLIENFTAALLSSEPTSFF